MKIIEKAKEVVTDKIKGRKFDKIKNNPELLAIEQEKVLLSSDWKEVLEFAKIPGADVKELQKVFLYYHQQEYGPRESLVEFAKIPGADVEQIVSILQGTRWPNLDSYFEFAGLPGVGIEEMPSYLFQYIKSYSDLDDFIKKVKAIKETHGKIGFEDDKVSRALVKILLQDRFKPDRFYVHVFDSKSSSDRSYRFYRSEKKSNHYYGTDPDDFKVEDINLKGKRYLLKYMLEFPSDSVRSKLEGILLSSQFYFSRSLYTYESEEIFSECRRNFFEEYTEKDFRYHFDTLMMYVNEIPGARVSKVEDIICNYFPSNFFVEYIKRNPEANIERMERHLKDKHPSYIRSILLDEKVPGLNYEKIRSIYDEKIGPEK